MINKIIDLYNAGNSSVTIGKTFSLSASNVCGMLRRAGVALRSNKDNSRKYNCNENVFETIDTEEKAYWLGFLYADGYVGSTTDTVGIALSIIDEAHLAKFKSFIQATYPINTYINNGSHKYCRLILNSIKMKNDLIKHGCTTFKTTTLTFPDLPSHLKTHFIRGYFDGDGSISFTNTVLHPNQYKFRLCGTSEFLSGVINILNLNNKLSQRWPERNVNNFDIDIGGNIQVLCILEKLYANSTIFLTRKHDRFIALRSLLSERAR